MTERKRMVRLRELTERGIDRTEAEEGEAGDLLRAMVNDMCAKKKGSVKMGGNHTQDAKVTTRKEDLNDR